MDTKKKRKHSYRLREEVLLTDLETVARFLGNDTVSIGQYEKHGRFAPGTYKQRFGKWNRALDLAGLVPHYCEYRRRLPSKGLRYKVLKRDKFKCVFCGYGAADGVKLQVDHIIPYSKGGLTRIDNLQTLCEACNLGKGTDESEVTGAGIFNNNANVTNAGN